MNILTTSRLFRLFLSLVIRRNRNRRRDATGSWYESIRIGRVRNSFNFFCDILR